MLLAASEGLNRSIDTASELQIKLNQAESIAAELTDEEIEKEGDEKRKQSLVVVRLTEREISIIRGVIEYQQAILEDADYYLYNIIVSGAWAAFEGYIQAKLADLYSKNCKLLSSDKTITVAQIIASGDGLLDFLIAEEIDDVGRKSFVNLQKYLGSKISLQISNKYVNNMQDVYFLCNVIAHSAGRLRKEQIPLVPEGVKLNGFELRLSSSYVKEVLECLSNAVREFDNLLGDKFGELE